ncbi:MAG: DNA (cytosine-5-)-methyltransferase [Bacillota bacterium]|nr:DNA (cytosine-5-)-methyltransferase [Bacillota bacterium]
MKFVDLFCGIGTIRMGMEQAGHECVYSVEWDKHKRQIYSIIFGKEPEGSDICAVDYRDIPKADCWCFGAPCQDFSFAGKRAGMEGERSSLVLEVFRLVRETPEEDRPKYLLYENVKGMLSSNGGRDFLGIISEMESLGYDIEWQLLNSKDFGVPQNRERVFTLGHLRGRSSRKVFPIERGNGKNLEQLIGGQQGMRVYDSGGVSCTISSHGGGWGAKTGLYAVGDKEDELHKST